MPIFDFECEKCKQKEERLVRRNDIETQVCATCGSKMPKTSEIHRTSFTLKGNWHH